MQRLSHKYFLYPFHVFLPIALAALIYSFFRWGDNIGLQVGRTYFIIDSTYFFGATSLFFIGTWAVYELMGDNIVSNYLTWLHVITTVLVVLLIGTVNYWHDSILPPFRNEFNSLHDMREQQIRESKIFLPVAAIFLTGQAGFIANLLGTLMRKKQRQFNQ